MSKKRQTINCGRDTGFPKEIEQVRCDIYVFKSDILSWSFMKTATIVVMQFTSPLTFKRHSKIEDIWSSSIWLWVVPSGLVFFQLNPLLSKLKWLRRSKCLLSHLRVAGPIMGHEHLRKPLGEYIYVAPMKLGIFDGTKQTSSLDEK